MGSFLNGPVWVPQIVRHLYKMDPKRDPNFENYPYALHKIPEPSCRSQSTLRVASSIMAPDMAMVSGM